MARRFTGQRKPEQDAMLVSMGDAGLIAPTSIPAPRRMWSDGEWDQLRRGIVGADWVAAVVGDRLLLSQVATGKSIYGARFRRELAGWKIVSADVEGDPSAYQPGSAERESERLQSVIERLLR
jgi:hypothetical protein